jgi:hypothetical protein
MNRPAETSLGALVGIAAVAAYLAGVATGLLTRHPTATAVVVAAVTAHASTRRHRRTSASGRPAA